MSDNIQFQSGTLASPAVGTLIATDAIGGTHWQEVKIGIGDKGTYAPVSFGTPLPIGTLAGGTLQIHGTAQIIGTVQPTPGSVHVANTISGTVQVHGTAQIIGSVQIHGTAQIIGTVQPLAGSAHIANTISGTVQTHGTSQVIGSVQIHGTAQIIGTVQTHGTGQVIGTFQPLAGSSHLATNLAGGTVVSVGSAIHGAVADARPHLMGVFGSSGTQAAVDDGDAVRLWADLNGRLQIRGTIDSMPAIAIGTISGGTIQAHGTTEILGTVRALTTVNVTLGTIAEGTVYAFGSVAHGAAVAGNPLLIGVFGSSGTQAAVDDGDSVRLWADLNGRLQIRGTIDSMPAIAIGTISGGTIQAHGTTQVIGTVQTHGTSQIIGTVQIHGTAQIIGTTQPLAGSVHLATNLAGGTVVNVGSAVHGAVSDTRPLLMGVFGSSGTQAAVDDGDAVRLWADLNGRLQIRGTIDSIPAITITAGTVSLNTGGTLHVGSVQRIAGTVETLGTTQPLAGSVHLATNLAGGTVVNVGSAVHGAVADTRPLSMGVFGSSGTQAAVDDGDAVRLWADLNGRLQVRGTIDSIPNITITAGTVSLNTGGTAHIGSVQRVAGTVDIGTVAGTVSIGTIAGLVRPGTIPGGTVVAQAGGFGSYFGTSFTAAASGTLIANPGQGTRWRIFDITVSLSASGTLVLQESASLTAGTAVFGPLFFAGSGGWQYNSARGILARGTNQGLYGSVSAGTMSITVNYTLES